MKVLVTESQYNRLINENEEEELKRKAMETFNTLKNGTIRIKEIDGHKLKDPWIFTYHLKGDVDMFYHKDWFHPILITVPEIVLTQMNNERRVSLDWLQTQLNYKFLNHGITLNIVSGNQPVVIPRDISHAQR